MYEILILVVASLFTVLAVGFSRRKPEAGGIFKSQRNRRISQLWRSAQSCMRENNLLQAEKALLTILTLDSKNAAAYNLIGILYARQKEYSHAAECFTAAYNLEENASSLHNQGMVYFNLEQYEKASISFKQALELDDHSALRYIEYAKVLERLGRNREVLEALEKAAEIEPRTEVLRLLLKAYKSRKMDTQAAAVEEKLKRLIKPASHQDHLQRAAKSVA